MQVGKEVGKEDAARFASLSGGHALEREDLLPASGPCRADLGFGLERGSRSAGGKGWRRDPLGQAGRWAGLPAGDSAPLRGRSGNRRRRRGEEHVEQETLLCAKPRSFLLRSHNRRVDGAQGKSRANLLLPWPEPARGPFPADRARGGQTL